MTQSTSCTRCARRKVRCDRRSPCSACIRHHANCHFKESAARRTRPAKRVKRGELLDKLPHYETVLDFRELAKEHNSPATRADTTSPQSSDAHTIHPIRATSCDTRFRNPIKVQIIQNADRSRLIDNSLWTRVVEELSNDDHTAEVSSDTASQNSEASDGEGSFLGLNNRTSKLSLVHPSQSQIRTLWQMYSARFDPMTKLIHVPTVSLAIEKAIGSMDTMPESLEALMFAIYLAAVTTMTPEECQSVLGQSRERLRNDFSKCTSQCLWKLNFMGTTSLVVLQVLMIFMISSRHMIEHRVMWSLGGIAFRIARGMGLDHDGAIFGVNVYGTELRRRLWWLLAAHDSQTAELCGMHKFRNIEFNDNSPKLPVLINDNTLRPEMSSYPSVETIDCDSLFIVAKYELRKFVEECANRYGANAANRVSWDVQAMRDASQGIFDASKALEELVQTKYLRYCDPSKPVHLVTMLVLRLSVNVVRFMIGHPRRWPSVTQIPEEERRTLWATALEILEKLHMLQTNSQISQFFWFTRSFVHLHSLIHMLDILRHYPLIEQHDRVWFMICDIFSYTMELAINRKNKVNILLAGLCCKAWDAREKAIQERDGTVPYTPDVIARLYQRRDYMRKKRRTRESQANEQSLSDNHTQKVSDTTSNVSKTISDLQDPFWFIDDQSDLNLPTHQNFSTNASGTPADNFAFLDAAGMASFSWAD